MGSDVVPCSASVNGDGLREFLVLFVRHINYYNMRFQEFEALAAMHGVPRSLLYVDGSDVIGSALCDSPLAIVRLPSEEVARSICERSVLVKAVIELWGTGPSVEDTFIDVEARSPRKWRRQFTKPPLSFRIRPESFGTTLQGEEKLELVEASKALFEGDESADLQNPDTTLWLIKEHGLHDGKGESVLRSVYFGRQVAAARSTDKKRSGAHGAYFHKYELSKRAVLGPTTLDNELSFIMANVAQVRCASTVFDPFSGTCGLLIAAAHFGAATFGAEIDIRVTHGFCVTYVKNKDAAEQVASKRKAQSRAADCGSSHAESDIISDDAATGTSSPLDLNARTKATDVASRRAVAGGAIRHDVFTNFLQYGLRLPEVVLCDNARQPWRQVATGWADAIITDPPYGIRAASKKQGREGEALTPLDEKNYIPPKVQYETDAALQDLLSMAAGALRDGGRLVYLLPVDLAWLLGIQRQTDPSLRSAVLPKGKRPQKDPRLCVSETTRDPQLIDEKRYTPFLPVHPELEPVGASLQVLCGGLGRLLVTLRRRPRA